MNSSKFDYRKSHEEEQEEKEIDKMTSTIRVNLGTDYNLGCEVRKMNLTFDVNDLLLFEKINSKDLTLQKFHATFEVIQSLFLPLSVSRLAKSQRNTYIRIDSTR